MSRSCSGSPAPAPTARRVLLIEDHPVLRQLLSDLLTQEGYLVECATSGIPGGPFDILLTDWVVPGLDVAHIVEQHLESTEASCILMSGYPINLEVFPELMRPRLRFLAKPFSASQLWACLNGLLRETNSFGREIG